MSTSHAIETRYAGHLFRSRLEARWAAFFDLLGWPWVYEPFDLAGYIPDFVLQFAEPLLVEVKPILAVAEAEVHAERIIEAGWRKEFLVVGADWNLRRDATGLCAWSYLPALGLIGERENSWGCARRWIGIERDDEAIDGGNFSTNDALLFECTECHRVALASDLGRWKCRVSGCYLDRGGHIDELPPQTLAALWGRAHELTRWKPAADPRPRDV